MNKKVIKSILLLALGIFIISFFAASLKTKVEDNKKEEIDPAKVKESLLIDDLKKETTISLSNGILNEIEMEEDFITDFAYYLNRAKKIEKDSSFEEIFEGQGDTVKFSTDFKILKIKKEDKEEYWQIPSEDEEGLKKLLDQGIYTAFDCIKKVDTWETVKVEYKEKSKQISKFNDLNEKIKKKRTLSEYQASKLGKEDGGFYITIKGKEYDIYLQTIGTNAIGIYYKNYKGYYEIEKDLYDYLCDIFYVAKEEREESISKENTNTYDWVEEIEIKDVVNKMDGSLDGKEKDDLLTALFSENMQEVKFDTYEVKRYSLNLKGKEKSEKITVYENHVEKNGVYYKVKNADLIIDSFMNIP